MSMARSAQRTSIWVGLTFWHKAPGNLVIVVASGGMREAEYLSLQLYGAGTRLPWYIVVGTHRGNAGIPVYDLS